MNPGAKNPEQCKNNYDLKEFLEKLDFVIANPDKFQKESEGIYT